MRRSRIEAVVGSRAFAAFRGWIAGYSGIGLALGTLAFAASLTPTLVPRTHVTQGALAGACFAAGYGLGLLWRWLWTYLELPPPPERMRRVANAGMVGLCLIVALVFLWRASEWQNSIRLLMAMEPVTSAHPTKVCLIAFATFAVLLALGHLFRMASAFAARTARRIMPARLATIVGLSCAVILFWSVANGVLFRAVLHLADASFSRYDALLEPERPQPTEGAKTGSPASLLRWDELGRAGREFIASRPDAERIGRVSGKAAQEPIRVYVGLRSAQTVEERARLALAEMKRVGAFERSVLVVITPTGTGWVDPSAIAPVEFLHHGDVASVAMQYSYLSSPLSLIVQPEDGSEAARALFAEVYGYWTTLPKDRRPRLYLHGLSLGAMNSERSAELFEMIGDPIQGALWSGPPFGSRIWRSLTNGRNPGSPAWLPEFRDGRLARFMNQQGFRVPEDAPWSVLRIVYLQYASDAVTFFDYRDFYRRPAWLEPVRGPDVSPQLQWYPIVTALQLAVDMAVATTPPIGYGHVYAPEHYVDAWVAVTNVRDWSSDALSGLKRHLTDDAGKAMADDVSEEGAYRNRGG